MASNLTSIKYQGHVPVSIQCHFDAVGKQYCDGDVIFKPNTALM